MKKSILTLAIATAMSSQVILLDTVSAEEEALPTINVESTKLSDVSEEQVKSADLAEALQKNVPSISIVRRSGISNDIILRGQKKDNINILIDDAKIYGACPNRMDPPTSHILTNNIEAVEITEGPYDVENFGTLSGAVKITTRKPSKELEGEVNLNLGSWGYRKLGATVSGGSDKVRALLSVSKETSEQYEDGDGNNFTEQQVAANAPAGNRYKPGYQDLDAYDKSSAMAKVFINLTENQELDLSYTANRSDDILYPSTPMDALYDDSDLFNLEYRLKDLGSYSKQLTVNFFKSTVDHPMSTLYRNASNMMGERVSHLETDTKGLKIKNAFDIGDSIEMTYGFDTSVRNWDGQYDGGMATGVISIDDVDTDNKALFVEVEKSYGKAVVKAGARYDDTTIETGGNVAGLQNNDYSNVSGFVFATYQLNDATKLFGGLGRAHRVPDPRELYFRNMGGMLIGTPTLEETRNHEIDFGVENSFDSLVVKTKLFYSSLTNYIHFNASKPMNKFENVDATIHGLDVSGSYFITDAMYLDFGMAYQRGKKDAALSGQTDTDLAEIPPLKANLAFNYEYAKKSSARVEVVAADKWDNFDEDNGEQALDSYTILNLKVQHQLTDQFEITAGIDNVFDKTYAISNTYNDLTLVSSGLTGEVMLLNEPGRYLYVNTTFRF